MIVARKGRVMRPFLLTKKPSRANRNGVFLTIYKLVEIIVSLLLHTFHTAGAGALAFTFEQGSVYLTKAVSKGEAHHLRVTQA